MEFLFLAAGTAAGLVIGYLSASRKFGSDREQLHAAKAETNALKRENDRIVDEIKTLREENKLLNAEASRRKEEAQQLRKSQETIEKTAEKMQRDFELAASKIFKSNSEELNKTGKEQIERLLNPFQKQMDTFEKKVDGYYQRELHERGGLKNELENLMKLNKQISIEAENLTKALKGDNKQQGNWGEVILERVLEQSGLERGREFRIQVHDKNEENRVLKPDVVVDLPEGKHLIIDSKVSLKHYEQFSSEKDEHDALVHLKLHVKSVKAHIDLLHSKHYHTAKSLNSPDFVLLFMPVEAAFTAAMRQSPDLFSRAWEQKIVIVSPTTLLATLKTVHSIWKQERQNKYAQEIAEEGGKLYNKFVGFIEDMAKIEKGLDSAKEAYSQAYKKLSSGRGNLVRRAEKMRELGAKTEKNIHDKHIEDE